MSGCKVVNHTADIGIRVRAETLEKLFVNAAEGMMNLVLRCLSAYVPKSRKTIEISVKAVDAEQLLVKWLQEILYLFETKRLVPVRFKILNLSDTALSAEVGVEPSNPKVHKIRHQIKAVTYHQLAIKKVDGRYGVTVIFDV